MRISFKIWYCKSFYRLKKEKEKERRNSIESTDELPARALASWKGHGLNFYLILSTDLENYAQWVSKSFLIKWAMVKFGHQKGGFFLSSQSYALASYDIGYVAPLVASSLFFVIIKLNILVLN